MKKYMLSILGILIVSSLYAAPANYSDSYTGKPRFKIKDSFNSYEASAYDSLIRIVNQYNEQNGLPSKYYERRTRFTGNAKNEIDLVPIKQREYTGFKDDKRPTGNIPIHEIITKGVEALEEKGKLNEVPKQPYWNEKKILFWRRQ